MTRDELKQEGLAMAGRIIGILLGFTIFIVWSLLTGCAPANASRETNTVMRAHLFVLLIVEDEPCPSDRAPALAMICSRKFRGLYYGNEPDCQAALAAHRTAAAINQLDAGSACMPADADSAHPVVIETPKFCRIAPPLKLYCYDNGDPRCFGPNAPADLKWDCE
jgi:hypothetical protein